VATELTEKIYKEHADAGYIVNEKLINESPGIILFVEASIDLRNKPA
jgi:hypothetical protein